MAAPRTNAEAPAETSVGDVVAREDLVLFINACFACTGQRAFYDDGDGQRLSIAFVHEYVLGNYRRLYARCLAAGINHFNQGRIVINLLAAGAPAETMQRREENALITHTIRRLPPHRVYDLFEELAGRRVNNRRTRAVMKAFFARRDPFFDAVKYRRKVKIMARHAHLDGVHLEGRQREAEPPTRDGEVGAFLFGSPRPAYDNHLLETFRRAQYTNEAVFELPYSVATGFAAKRGISQKALLERGNLTAGERLRLQRHAVEEKAELALDLGAVPLTRLAIYVASLPRKERADRREELSAALNEAAVRACPPRWSLGRVAAVLDRSYSSSGSFERRRRPLAVALAVSRMLRRAAAAYLACWTPRLTKEERFGFERDRPEADLFAAARGPTNLADALLRALRWRPDLVVLVSDGYENDPPGAATQVVRAYRQRIDPRVAFVHVNPVFDAERFVPRALGADLPTVGIRDAADLPTVLEFAAFSWGARLSAPAASERDASREPRRRGATPLETYLGDLVRAYVGGDDA